MEELTITLYDQAGEPYDATLLTTFQAVNRDYAAFLSHRMNDNGEYDIELFRYELTEQDGQEGIELSMIASDMEYEEVREVLIGLIEDWSGCKGLNNLILLQSKTALPLWEE